MDEESAESGLLDSEATEEIAHESAYSPSFPWPLLALALAGVLFGAIALYLAYNSQSQHTATLAELKSTQTQLGALEEKFSSVDSQSSVIDKQNQKLESQIRQVENQFPKLVQQMKSALQQVGNDIRTTREQATLNTQALEKINQLLTQQQPQMKTEPKVAPNPTVTTMAPESPQTESPGTHKIAAGETFGKIAKQYGVTVAAILEANPDTNPKRLQIGQEIQIP